MKAAVQPAVQPAKKWTLNLGSPLLAQAPAPASAPEVALRAALQTSAAEGLAALSLDIEIHPAAELMPRMTESEFAAFCARTDERGYSADSKIVLIREPAGSPGRLLDGRHRWAYLRSRRKDPFQYVIYWDELPENERCGSPVDYVLAKGLDRRHLTAIQYDQIAAKRAVLLAAEARQRQLAGIAPGGTEPQPADLGDGSSPRSLPPAVAPRRDSKKKEAGKSVVRAAQAVPGAGIGGTRILLRALKQAPDLSRLVDEGRIKNVAHVQAVLDMPPEVRADAVKRIQASEDAAKVVKEIQAAAAERASRWDDGELVQTGDRISVGQGPKPMPATLLCPVPSKPGSWRAWLDGGHREIILKRAHMERLADPSGRLQALRALSLNKLSTAARIEVRGVIDELDPPAPPKDPAPEPGLHWDRSSKGWRGVPVQAMPLDKAFAPGQMLLWGHGYGPYEIASIKASTIEAVELTGYGTGHQPTNKIGGKRDLVYLNDLVAVALGVARDKAGEPVKDPANIPIPIAERFYVRVAEADVVKVIASAMADSDWEGVRQAKCRLAEQRLRALFPMGADEHGTPDPAAGPSSAVTSPPVGRPISEPEAAEMERRVPLQAERDRLQRRQDELPGVIAEQEQQLQKLQTQNAELETSRAAAAQRLADLKALPPLRRAAVKQELQQARGAVDELDRALRQLDMQILMADKDYQRSREELQRTTNRLQVLHRELSPTLGAEPLPPGADRVAVLEKELQDVKRQFDEAGQKWMDNVAGHRAREQELTELTGTLFELVHLLAVRGGHKIEDARVLAARAALKKQQRLTTRRGETRTPLEDLQALIKELRGNEAQSAPAEAGSPV